MDAKEANEYILKKYGLNGFDGRMPATIPITRDSLSELFCELGYKIGAEIGVEQGLFSESLCKNNPGVKHHCIDAWKAYKGYRDHVNQQKLDGFKKITEERLAPYGCVIIQGFSLDVVKQFENESLDYVYIDGNHDFQNCCNDIVEWGKKVRHGGIISGHDFDKHHSGRSFIHVNECVYAYASAYRITPWFTTKPQTHNSRSFLWVKQ